MPALGCICLQCAQERGAGAHPSPATEPLQLEHSGQHASHIRCVSVLTFSIQPHNFYGSPLLATNNGNRIFAFTCFFLCIGITSLTSFYSYSLVLFLNPSFHFQSNWRGVTTSRYQFRGSNLSNSGLFSAESRQHKF